jgi:hypothetical protein
MHTVLSTKTWVWCGGTQPCEERDGDNQVTQRFFAQNWFHKFIGESVIFVCTFFTRCLKKWGCAKLY